ncbi:MAG: citrate/2-methylcitrate synthase [Eubacterium sp.]|jgi:citrate synthase|nr:citrate/2-methylcitrate synthase [Eubacterium sp.]
MTERELLQYMLNGEVLCRGVDVVDPKLYDEYGVKRGLRDLNGHGVLTGVTNISKVVSSKIIDGQEVFCDGELWYRGYNVIDMVKDFGFNRFGFEEMAYLLLFGELPNERQLCDFRETLGSLNHLPTNFTRDVIMKAPSHDIMNSMTKSVLTLASYDDYEVSDLSISNVLRQCMALISEFPMLAVYGYCAYNHYEKDESMYIHRPDPKLSTAENFLRMLRPDRQYSELEAQVLDAALVLHMEHGGGNNSTFTTRVVSSAGSDTYSVIAAALSSLKGPKHGGANIKVMQMMEDIRAHVPDYNDKAALKDYLAEIVDKKAFDRRGLIYGMGHAIYAISDPRARAFKEFVDKLAVDKHMERELQLYNNIEQIAPEVIAEKRRIYKGVSANVDFYSGFVYSMLGIPVELYTPLFAVARIVGWSAHRIEELINVDKIIRPAYKSIMKEREYTPIESR